MSKKKLNNFFDDLMWYVIYLLPLIALLLCSLQGNLFSISEILSKLGLSLLLDSPMVGAFNSLFGSTGILPIFQSLDMIYYLCYFIYMLLLHVAVDALAFVPRIAHKFMGRFCE